MAGAVNTPSDVISTSSATQRYSKNSYIKVIDNKTQTHHTFEVSFYNDKIRTTVTPDTSIVDKWIKDVYKLEDGNNLIVGLDIEWVRLRQTSHRNKVAVLQLCLAHKCLIFQFLVKHEVPESLINFLNDERIIFVGSGIDQDARKLWVDYGLNVARSEDLAGLADFKLRTTDLYQSGLETLMWKVLRKNLPKPKRLTLSRWDFDFLSNEQVAYACLDAYASFKLGMKLMPGPKKTVNKMVASSSFSIKTLENKPWALFLNSDMSTQLISSCRELSGYDGFSFSFLSELYGINAEDHKLYILASTNGFVLCSVVHECTGVGRYFVCNPITKESVSLPPPPRNTSVGDFTYGLVCDTYSHSPAIACESAFKVVRTQNSLMSDRRLKIEIYFSDLDEWKTYDVADNQQREGTRQNVITHNGVVYWIEEGERPTDEWEGPINRVICCDLNKIDKSDSHQCDVLDVPILYRHLRRERASSECLGVSGDFVFYGHIRKNVLRIWVLTEKDLSVEERGYYSFGSESRWDRICDFNLPCGISLLGFSPTDCGVVILGFEDQVFALDVVATEEPDKTSLLEHILCEPSRENSFNPDGNSEFLHSLCVLSGENSFNQYGKSEVLHSKCFPSYKTQRYSPIIVTPTLTTISKAKNSIRKI